MDSTSNNKWAFLNLSNGDGSSTTADLGVGIDDGVRDREGVST